MPQRQQQFPQKVVQKIFRGTFCIPARAPRVVWGAKKTRVPRVLACIVMALFVLIAEKSCKGIFKKSLFTKLLDFYKV